MAIIALWGGAFVYSLAITLSAPDRPLLFNYKTPGGELKLTATSYAFDFVRGDLRIQRPMVLDPAGESLLSAEYVEARNLFASPSSGRVMSIKVRDVKGTIVRLKDGKLPLLSYLPKASEQPSQVPYHVEIDRIQTEVIDYSGAAPWSQKASSKKVIVDGVGAKWLAAGIAQLDGIGKTSFAAQGMDKDGYLLKFNSTGLDLTDVAKHFASTPEGKKTPMLADFKADKLVANGPFSVQFNPDGKFAFDSTLDVSGRGVQYRNEPKADTTRFIGYVTNQGLNGTLTAKNSTADATFKGSISWVSSLEIGGQLQAKSSNERALGPTLLKLLPKGLAYRQANYDGWFAYDAKGGFQVDGDAKAASVVFQGETLSNPVVQARADKLSGDFSVASLQFRGSRIQGQGHVDFKTHGITAGLTSKGVPLEKVAAQFNIPGLTGTADVEAFITGTLDKPLADLRTHGKARYADKRLAKVVSGDFEAAANVDGSHLKVIRSALHSPGGSMSATGDIDLSTKKLALKVVGTGVLLADFVKDTGGTGAFLATVTGTVQHPTLSGRTEIYGGNYQGIEVPVLAANVVADKESMTASDIRAVSGASEATGKVHLVYKTGAISGNLGALGLQLSDFFDSGVTGTVDLKNAMIGGTLSSPTAVATVTGQTLVAKGVKVDTATALVSLKGKQVSVDGLVAKAADGEIDASGSYNLDSKSGSLDAVAKQIAIDKALPDLTAQHVALDGTLSGEAKVRFDHNGLTEASGKGNFANVVLNQTDLGDGPWSFETTNRVIKGSATVGFLERFIELQNLTYDTQTKVASGDLNLLSVQLSDIFKTATPLLVNVSADNLDRLRSLTGSLGAKTSFTGTWPNLDFQVPALTIDAMALGEHPLGAVVANFGKKGSVWSIRDLSWKEGDSSLKVRGRVDEKAGLSLDGEISKFDLSNLALIDQKLSSLSGSADLSFLASGSTKAPEIDASLKSDRLLVSGLPNEQKTEFGVLIDSLHIEESHLLPDGTFEGGISAEGEFRYRGIVGQLTSHIPFNYQVGIPAGEPLNAQIEVPNRELKTLTEFYSGLDDTRTKGTVQGLVKLFGPIDALKAEGNVTAKADVFALKGTPSTLNKAVADLTFRNDELALAVTGTSSAGGSVDATAKTKLEDFGKILSSIVEGDAQDILANTVSGTASLKDFHVIQDGGKDGGNVDAVASANLNLSGTIQHPLLKGDATVNGATVTPPGQGIGQFELQHPIIDPAFDITLNIGDIARVKTSTASLDLTGSGRLTGSLSYPNLTANLNVESGTLKLPTARVAIQPDGTLKLLYQVTSSGDLNARMDVNLEGTTSLTALRFGDTIERYDIYLNVRGDLFKDGGLNLTATSDPPDLTQDRILALLGQTDVLQAFGSGVSPQDAQKQIRDALTGLAVPVLLDPITSRLASSLGLQYLSVEYNAYEEATFAFAKVLGKNLILQGRRQLSEPIIGVKPRYELKLTYRIPVSKGVLSRTTLSIGADQDRPWKIAVEYGIRF